MIDQSKLTGIVLSVRNLGENDKSLTVLTKERGKVQLTAQRARRQNSPLFTVSQPFVYAEFVVTYKRNYTYLNSAECRDTFGDFRDDFDAIMYATYFAEVAEYCTVEMQDERNILNLLYVTFQAIRRKKVPFSLMKSIFEYRILQYNGIGLQVSECIHCAKEKELHYLSFEKGGVLCDDCGQAGRDHPLNDTVLYTLQYIASMPIPKLYSFILQPEIEVEVRWIIHRFFRIHMDYNFKSENMLDLL